VYGNTAYRVSALAAIGFFDESLGYGYDNDVSYRLRAAGYRLVMCPDARSIHQWRDGWRAYFRQQYGFGYGRLDLVAKHRRRVAGDDVSPLSMMLHAPLFGTALRAAGAQAVDSPSPATAPSSRSHSRRSFSHPDRRATRGRRARGANLR
jgi:hypothetical protein